jgi:mutator protein MutT
LVKAGLIAVREGRVLLFRKHRGTRKLILPGGKLEAGETAQQALVRELREEMSGVSIRNLRFLGRYQHQAADDDRQIGIELFTADLRGDPFPASEIAEIVWFDWNTDNWSELAPSLKEKIFPDLLTRGILRAV